MQNIIYNIKLEIFGCSYTLRINDTKIFENKSGSGVTAEVPVKEFVTKGKNKFTYLLYPQKKQTFLHENSTCKISLLKVSDDGETKVVFTKIAPPFKSNKPTQTFASEEIFEVTEHLPGSDIYSLPELKSMGELKKKLSTQYQKIWQYFKTKDIAAVMSEFSIKNKEYSLLYGLNQQEQNKKCYETLENVFSNGWDLWDIDYPNLSMEISFFNRIVTFYNKNGKSPLLLYNKEINITTYFKLFFCCMPNSDDFKIIL